MPTRSEGGGTKHSHEMRTSWGYNIVAPRKWKYPLSFCNSLEPTYTNWGSSLTTAEWLITFVVWIQEARTSVASGKKPSFPRAESILSNDYTRALQHTKNAIMPYGQSLWAIEPWLGNAALPELPQDRAPSNVLPFCYSYLTFFHLLQL